MGTREASKPPPPSPSPNHQSENGKLEMYFYTNTTKLAACRYGFGTQNGLSPVSMIPIQRYRIDTCASVQSLSQAG